jgi:hypothetical protein
MLILTVFAAHAISVTDAPQSAAGPRCDTVSIPAIGDLDGDGLAEVALACPYYSPLGTREGRITIFHGGTLAPYATLDGVTWGELGWALTVADVNCDGLLDLVAAASGSSAGGVFVWHGPVPAGASDTSHADVSIYADNPVDRIGHSLLAGADFTGDGCGDLVVGAIVVSYGQSYDGSVYLMDGVGLQSGAVGAVSFAVLEGSNPGGRLGAAVAATDIDGDGLADLIASAPGGGADAGRLHVVPGSTIITGGTWQVDTISTVLEPHPLVRGIGQSMAVADVDGDGVDELLVGAPYSSIAGDFDGVACLVGLAGIPLAPGTQVSMSPRASCIRGSYHHAYLGSSLVFAPWRRGQRPGFALLSEGMANSGSTLLWDLGNRRPPGRLALATGSRIESVPSRWVDTELAVGGDVDGDGFEDVAIAVTNGADSFVTVW